MKNILIIILFFLLSCQKKNDNISDTKNLNWYTKDDKNDIIVFPDALRQDKISIAGSSTVYPIAESVVEEFKNDGFKAQINLDSIGSGGGFKRFCLEGSSDISTSSRKIKDSELKSCKKINRNPIEFQIGIDALSVVVNKKNNFIKNASISMLKKIFTAKYWSDVNPQYPKELIKRFIPGTDSGTFDYFNQTVFGGDHKSILNAANTQKSEDDEILVKGIEDDKFSIGFFGYEYYNQNKDKLKVLSINGIFPSKKDLEKYPIARPLYLYTDKKILEKKPQVLGYLLYFFQNAKYIVPEVGYFVYPQDENKDRLKSFIK